MLTLRAHRPPRCHVTTDHNGWFIGRHHCQTHGTRWFGTEDCPDQEPERRPIWKPSARQLEVAELISIALAAGAVVTMLVVVLVLTVATAAGAL